MALPTYISTGTATATAGSTAVVGFGTAWLTTVRAGDVFGLHKGYAIFVASVTDDTHLVLADNVPAGMSQTNAAYKIQVTSEGSSLTASVRLLLESLRSGILSAFTGLTSAANKLPFFTGSGTMGVTDFTVYGQSLVGAADAAAAQTTLGMSAYFKTLLGSASAAVLQGLLGVRERLAANRTYYVRADGSDANNGLTNVSGGAFLTLQKAADIVDGLDLNGFTATIKATGTFTAGINFRRRALGGSVILDGDTTTPANAYINSTGTCITVQGGAVVSVQGFKLTTAARGIFVTGAGSMCTVSGNMEYGACTQAHNLISNNGSLMLNANYSITGGSFAHLQALLGGLWECYGRTITLVGTPAISVFAFMSSTSASNSGSMVFSGSATGQRYSCDTNAVLSTGGGGASYFPGNSAGAVTTGGQYA